MVFRRGQKVELYRKSEDESWEPYMDEFVGLHGIVTDPDTAINDPDALVEISLEGKGTHRLPQDCLQQAALPAKIRGLPKLNFPVAQGDLSPFPITSTRISWEIVRSVILFSRKKPALLRSSKHRAN